MYKLIGVFAGIISMIAFVPYIISILKKETQPSRASWIIWTVVALMILSSYKMSGAVETIWVPVSYFLGPFVVAILSVKYGVGGWTRMDRFCLISTGVSIILWYLFNSALLALYINIFIDFLGALPTMKKAYHEPESENKPAWVLFFSGNVLNLFATDFSSFAVASYPLYMFCATGIICTFVLLRPRRVAT